MKITFKKRKKRIDASVYLGSVVEKNDIQNKINYRIGKDSKFYDLTKCLLGIKI